MRNCLTSEELDRLSEGADDGAGDDTTMRGVREHLAGCGDCRAALADAREDGELFGELRAAAVFERSAGGDLAPRVEIDNFRILREIHRGGQGVVYEALQEATGRRVALKVLLRGPYASAGERRRFEREIELVAGLQHPHLITVYDSGIAGPHPYYAMELVHGRRLDRFLAEREPPTAELLELFAKIARAVGYAHQHGVIHRDLKPGNILVDDDGTPHVVDFGLAKLTGAFEARITQSGEFMGTLAYAAPEQVSGETNVGTPADVYAIGMMLYEALVGSPPYTVDGPLHEVIGHITGSEPRSPRALARQSSGARPIDVELESILMRALAKEPGRRYANAEAFAADLQRYQGGRPIEARSQSTWYVLRKAVRRNKEAIGVVSVFALLAAIALSVIIAQRIEASRQRSVARQVGELFQEIVAAASPDRMGAQVRLVDVLGEVAGEIESSLGGVPDLREAVQLSIGDTYRRLLMWEPAQRHLRAAYESARDRGDRLETAHCGQLLGEVLSANRLEEGVALQRESLALREELLPPGDARIAESRRGLAFALHQSYRSPRPEEAERLYRVALAEFESLYGGEHPEVARTLHLLATLLGDGAEAGALFARGQKIFERGADAKEPRSVECALDYAAYLLRSGQREESAALLQQALEWTRQIYSEDRVIGVLRSIAWLHKRRGDVESAQEINCRAIGLELERWARLRPDQSVDLLELAARVADRGTASDERPYAEAFAVLREHHPPGAYELMNWMTATASILREQGRADVAEPLLSTALTIDCRIYGLDCPVRVGCLQEMGELLVDEGRAAGAIEFLREAVDTKVRMGELQSGDPTCELLGRCLRATGQGDEGPCAQLERVEQ